MPTEKRQRRDRVLGGGGCQVLGRQPIADRRDETTGAGRDLAADAVMGVEVADDPSAAMVIDEQRRIPLGRGLWPVEPQRDRAGRPLGRQIVDGRHLHDRTPEAPGLLAVEGSCLVDRDLITVGRFASRIIANSRSTCGSKIIGPISVPVRRPSPVRPERDA